VNTLATYEAADLLKLWVQGHYTVSTGDAGTFASPGQCVPKAPGQLGLLLTPAEIGYPLGFDLSLKGSHVGADGSGRPLVLLEIDKQIDRYVPELDITVERIEGRLTLALREASSPVEDTSCGGQCHPFVVDLESVGPDNTLTIHVRKTVLGVDHGAVVEVKPLSCLGAAAQDLSKLTVIVHEMKNECGVGSVAGGIGRFWVSVLGLPSGVDATYDWSVSGASAIGATDEWSLRVAVPDPGQLFSVSVAVSVAGCTIRRRLQVTPLSPYTAQLIEHVCGLMMEYTWINLFFDPLGPDVRLPLSREHLLAVERGAENVLRLTRTLSALRSDVQRPTRVRPHEHA
jgi:hypothetical protein